MTSFLGLRFSSSSSSSSSSWMSSSLSMMKYPRNFDSGLVGLGIVAAMSDDKFPGKPRWSDPIPIISATSNHNKRKFPEAEMYNCLSSRVGNTDTSVTKRTYFADDDDVVLKSTPSFVCWDDPAPAAQGLFFQSSSPIPLPVFSSAEDFLRRCNLCNKSLDGCDVFMYRGEKAFCSVECRYRQIISEEQYIRSEARKLVDYSVSPGSVPLQCAAGVAAA